MRDGFRCEQTFINYLPTYTAPGHASIYTGTVPAIHGIAGNDWFERGKYVYCTEDKTVKPVGGSLRWGQMSPRPLLTTTITDELRLATNKASRVFAVSLKDRSSILPAGHLGQAYWFDDSTGNFSTSSYYQDSLPAWLQRFNEERWADSVLSRDWKLADLRDAYLPNTNDIAPRYEGKFSKDEPGVTFPHGAQYLKGGGSNKYNGVRRVPLGNWLTLQLAKRCVQANKLGQGSDADFLCISLSSADYIGHQFGPNSLEVEDMCVRLDRDLARLLRFLDDYVGRGDYTVFLTADHGGAHNSLFMEDNNIPAGNVSEPRWQKELNEFLKTELGVDSVVIAIDNYQVYYKPQPKGRPWPLAEVKEATKRWLKSRPEVAYVIDLEEPRSTAPIPEPLQSMTTNGYHASRSGSIQIILKPGYYAGYAPTGTTHGSWNPYDSHIPLLWYGWGIPKGQTNREVRITDISATLAALLHIQMPNGCVGKVITEIVR
jgi:hypothetical protein